VSQINTWMDYNRKLNYYKWFHSFIILKNSNLVFWMKLWKKYFYLKSEKNFLYGKGDEGKAHL
jgi:hypothetical protein